MKKSSINFSQEPLKSYVIVCCFLFVSTFAKSQSYKLWYDKPAQVWTEALPIGNGSLAAMIYGGANKETIQFNEETVWSGQPHDYAHKNASRYLDSIRGLLFAGKQQEAQRLADKEFMSQPYGQQAYQPLGNVQISFKGQEQVDHFYRDLSFDNALASVSYEVNGVKYMREMFASYPDKAIFIKLSTNKAKALNCTIELNCPHSIQSMVVINNELVLKGNANDYPPNSNYEKKGNYKYPSSKINFESRLLVQQTDGTITPGKGSIEVTNASTVVLKLVAATNFVNYKDISASPSERCTSYLNTIRNLTYEDARQKHFSDYQKLYKRTTINLGFSKLSERPTNERLQSYAQDKDPNLVALLFQYGRYLLIASSRPGSQPANLQGKWNDKLTPPWDSKYTVNINTEMNYWPAEITNLSECTEPLFHMLKDLAVTGQNVAKEHYQANGWVLHHNTDLWRGTAPINGANHGIWISGSGWLCQHLWWHYEFTGDKKFLRETAYPIMKAAAAFYADYLIPHPQHPQWLVSGPSNSPEQGGLVMGPTMDHQIIRNLFANTSEAAKLLGVDKEFSKILSEKGERIVPNQIGRYGQLQEWVEDKDDPTSEHRHVSHLWGLHPGNEISPFTTPELAKASKVVLQHRGDEGTGWSRAWKINFWARLLDGDHAFLILNNLLVPSIKLDNGKMIEGGGLYPNLLDACPPFQIDGNFGATSGITEMLLQSHLRDKNGDYYLDILPALPTKFDHGKVSGLVARGGFVVGIDWEKNEIVKLNIVSKNGNRINIRYKGKLMSINTQKGKSYQFTSKDF